MAVRIFRFIGITPFELSVISSQLAAARLQDGKPVAQDSFKQVMGKQVGSRKSINVEKPDIVVNS